MNYTLTISLEGADKADAQLDKLLSKIGNLETLKIDKLIDQSGILGGGERAGESAGKSFAKKFKQYGMADLAKEFSKSGFTTPQVPDWMNKSFFNQKSSLGVIKGLRDITGKDLGRVFSLPDINSFENKIDKKGLLTAGIATLFNPFVGARMLSDIIPKGGGGSSGGGGIAGAIFGGAGAAGYAEIFVVVKLLQTAFKALVAAIQRTVQAYDEARKLYAKALTSGLGLNFSVKRGMLAEILGVSETEVIRFGSAWTYLNQRISFASEQLAKTATPLAGVGYEFKIMDQNVKALWSQIAFGLAPAVKSLVSEFNDFMSTLGNTQYLQFIGDAISRIIQQTVNLIGLIEIVINAQYVAYKNVYDLLHGDFKDIKKTDSAFVSEIQNWFKNMGGSKLNDVPPPQAWMKQLGASTLEKMGLVVGGGGNTTNNLIRKSNSYLKELPVLVRILSGARGSDNFGMSPTTSNP